MTEHFEVDAFRSRTAQQALLLTFVHTLPVIWLTPVAGGTVPAVALLAVGLAGLFSFDSEGLALGLMGLIPGLVYLGLAWLLAWLLAWAAGRLPRWPRLVMLAVLIIVPLVAVYFPIYVVGGHSSTTSASLFELLEGYPGLAAGFFWYWIGLHGVLAGLFLVQIPGAGSRLLAEFARWTPRVLRAAMLLLVGTLVWQNFTTVVCRPVAFLGVDAAQLCVARAGGPEARYWYERAGMDGNPDALAWLVDNTPNRSERLKWLRLGADAGVPAMQFELSRFLDNYGGEVEPAEAARWRQAAVRAGYPPALMAEVERMTEDLQRAGSPALLAERNVLLESAAAGGSSPARLRLAEHYERGSMGYPVDLEKARRYYQRLADEGEPPEELARVMRATGDSYEARLARIDRWQSGLARRDPAVLEELGRLYLNSELPGDGVREKGLALLE